MRYADLRKYDISNWNGVNTTLFVTGCHFHCEGCWNLEAQDFNYGTETKIFTYFHVREDGITLFGFKQKEEKNLLRKKKKEVLKKLQTL